MNKFKIYSSLFAVRCSLFALDVGQLRCRFYDELIVGCLR